MEIGALIERANDQQTVTVERTVRSFYPEGIWLRSHSRPKIAYTRRRARIEPESVDGISPISDIRFVNLFCKRECRSQS